MGMMPPGPMRPPMSGQLQSPSLSSIPTTGFDPNMPVGGGGADQDQGGLQAIAKLAFQAEQILKMIAQAAPEKAGDIESIISEVRSLFMDSLQGGGSPQGGAPGPGDQSNF